MNTMRRTVRFGFQLGSEHEHDPVGVAKRAEELGFDVVLLSDHVGPGISPLVTLAAMAQATTRIRLGTYVLNNDMRNPVQLAWEAVTLDRLSGGRFELGIGAGHTPQEYDHVGLLQDRPQVRKARLAESVEIARHLVDGELVDFEGEHYQIRGAQLDRSVQERLPIMVAGNGAALLGHAGAHADIIGLQGMGKTREDGHSHRVKWDPEHLDLQLEQIRAGAGQSPRSVEINVLVQVAEVTDDRDAKYAELVASVEGLTLEHAAQTPYLLVGTVDEIVDQILGHRERWGITYFGVRTLDDFGPVIAAFRAHESAEDHSGSDSPLI
jgi:probable F420-dependent oxidoreductase